jgi:hypothetical protein
MLQMSPFSRWIAPFALAGALLAGCGAPAAQAPAAGTAASNTSAPATTAASSNSGAERQADLSGVKTYLLDKSTALQASTAKLKSASDGFYNLAKDAKFDYAALMHNQKAEVAQTLEQAKAAWVAASPLYESMEGIVAGTPSLARYDVILDAGTSAAEGGDDVTPIDVKLPDGRTLAKPGNLFGLTETALWGTSAAYVVPQIQPDFNGNGKIDFGEALPDAQVLKGGVDALHQYANELLSAAKAWQPTEAEAFGALVGNVPTIGDFFEAWKNSRFVAGGGEKSRDFVAISRLSDMQGNVASWQVMYNSLSPLVRQTDPAQDAKINGDLESLHTFISGLYTQEQGGKQFTAEEAELLSSEAQNRATAITGQISQVAAKLNIPIQE